ncbi:MAG TPA: nitrite reductase large subunit NirB [Hyphomicrobium sp.]|nr:nitrite reductase large subunit NirB [Hyphomicrobium sp.]
MSEKLVIIGNGMAPGRMLEHLLAAAPGRYEVTIFNAEPRVNYDRIMLSPVLSGEKDFEEIVIHGDGWYIKNGITLYKGHKVTGIDRVAKTVASDRGVVQPYDKLVIATGSVPLILPVPGNNLPGVLTYRDLDDVNAMLIAAQSRAKAVVIGGGLLGLEAAAGLSSRDTDVTVVHLMPTLMERQLDPAAGYMLQRELEGRGIKILTKAQTKAILGERRVEGVELADGRIVPATLVVMAAGIRPNAGLAKEAGLAVERGILVDAGMRTSDPDIIALGECAEVGGHVYGLVAPLYEMARVAAAHLAGDGTASFVHNDTPTKLKVTGIDVFSLGDFADGDDRQEIVLRDASAGVYKRLILKDNRIIGTVLFGETTDGAWFNDLKKRQVDITEMRDTLIFGQAYQGGSPLDPMAAVAALPDDAEICGCNGVCKGKITGAIREKALATLDGVRAHTKASASCGSCTGLVEQLMRLALGDAYNPAAVQPMCACTSLGHDDVRRLIKAKGLKTIHAVMQELEWKTSCGCAKCRPALNYYLVCDWPGEYADDYQSRFINERAHANIQKDGTYSVVPRMWGGVTSAKELRAIADVVDKFSIPTVKVTGGQRIDMLGVKKEDLPAVWAELGKAGFVSGHAYAKGLRTVKTCVGTDWCRFGTQDSTGLGIRIEKFMWGSWTPAKVKMAVSGCPRNCAEATCKDVGVVCVDSGYEIHFAGAAGLDIKGTEVLGLVKTEDEALEVIVALVQMYREQARYLERIYKWARRVGVPEIRRQVLEDRERRKAFFDRFVYSQKFAQVDPWSERASGKDKHEFQPLAAVGFAEAAE